MKYFLFNHNGSLNHGCEAIIRSTIAIVSKADPKAKFILSSFNPETDQIIDGVDLRKFETRELNSIEHVIAALNIKLGKSEDYALKNMYSNVAKQAKDCDICLSVGGDTYCYGNNRYIQVLTKELKKQGKKVILWGASIGKEDLTKEKAESLKDFDAIFAREPLTYELLKSLNLNNNIFFFSDPAFCLERERWPLVPGFTPDKTVGLNVSPLVEKSNSKMGKITDGFIKFLLEKTDYKLMLIPHVVERDNNDYEYLRPFYEKHKHTNRIAILPQTLNAKQYKGYISRLRFFIGARTHATIAAYSSAVPTIVIGYSVKSHGIATDLFGKDEFVINSERLESEDELINQFNMLCESEDKIRTQLRNVIPQKIINAYKAGEQLMNI